MPKLVSQQISSFSAPVDLPVEHIAVIDVSGSMGSDLPELRRHLKNKLPSLVGERDTVSLIWFSGNGQFGVLQEAVPVRSLTDLSSLNAAIDKFLQPIGLTGFKQPLEEVVALIGRLKKSRSDSLINLLFMTDGYENQNPEKSVLSVCESLSSVIDAATIIEYGWNCNRALLSKMADAVGGSQLFSERFEQYQAVFEGEMTKKIGGGKKVSVKLNESASLGYAFSFDAAGHIVTFSVNEQNSIVVPESVGSVYFYTDGKSSGNTEAEDYIGLATLSQRMLANEIFDVLASVGDVRLINKFVNAFSKQDYSDFQSMCVDCAINPASRFLEGKDLKAVPKEDAFTVLDLLNLLAEDSGNLLYPMDESFGYKRIGSGQAQRDDSVKFKANDKNPGVPLNGIVYNEDRPNVSIRVRIEGDVTLPNDRVNYPKLPASVPSYIYRNYTIIRDGIVHTRVLPVSLTESTIAKLSVAGVIDAWSVTAGVKFNLDISKLPVINRNMVKTVKASDTFKKVFELEVLKAKNKVLNFYLSSLVEKKSEGFAIIYGEDAASWLKDIGITDYNGFNPPSDRVSSQDSYMAKLLKISVSKLSSLPAVKDVIDKAASGKALTLRESIMLPAIEFVEEFYDSDVVAGSADQHAVKVAWLRAELDANTKMVRKLNLEISKTKFAIIVGHVWFSDLPAGEGEMSFTDQKYGNVTVVADLVEKEIGGSD